MNFPEPIYGVGLARTSSVFRELPIPTFRLFWFSHVFYALYNFIHASFGSSRITHTHTF